MQLPSRIIISTRNPHKVGEIRAILGAAFEYFTLADFPDAPEVVEDAGSFAGNATKKAVELARWLSAAGEGRIRDRAGRVSGREVGERGGAMVLADDSGLEVDALGGEPGVHSARFAGLGSGQAGNSSPVENNAKLLRLLAGVPAAKRTARFRCVVAVTPSLEAGREGSSPVCYADEFELQTRLFEGVCEGRIGFELKGKAGFGYDPLFVPEGYSETFAELGETEKNGLSHRGRALGKLKAALGLPV